jgi:hypothetical protein
VYTYPFSVAHARLRSRQRRTRQGARPSLTFVFFVSFVVSCLFFVAFVVSCISESPVMHKLLILSIHFLLAGFGGLEYCISKRMRRFKCKPGSHYSCRINYQHPAYQNIMISLDECPREASLTSYMLCTAHKSGRPLLISGKITLN